MARPPSSAKVTLSSHVRDRTLERAFQFGKRTPLKDARLLSMIQYQPTLVDNDRGLIFVRLSNSRHRDSGLVLPIRFDSERDEWWVVTCLHNRYWKDKKLKASQFRPAIDKLMGLWTNGITGPIESTQSEHLLRSLIRKRIRTEMGFAEFVSICASHSGSELSNHWTSDDFVSSLMVEGIIIHGSCRLVPVSQTARTVMLKFPPEHSFRLTFGQIPEITTRTGLTCVDGTVRYLSMVGHWKHSLSLFESRDPEKAWWIFEVDGLGAIEALTESVKTNPRLPKFAGVMIFSRVEEIKFRSLMSAIRINLSFGLASTSRDKLFEKLLAEIPWQNILMRADQEALTELKSLENILIDLKMETRAADEDLNRWNDHWRTIQYGLSSTSSKNGSTCPRSFRSFYV